MRLSKLRKRMIEAEVETWPEWQQVFYHDLRKKNSITMAHMLASRQPPRCLTDDVLMSGQTKIKDLPDDRREYICKKIKESGGSVNPDDVYKPGLARFTGDPEAIVGHGDYSHRIHEIGKKRGVKIEGPVSCDYTREIRDDKKPVHKLHPRIVERNVDAAIQENPDLARKDRNKLRAAVIDKHSAKEK